MKKLYEILVPKFSNDGLEYTVLYHNKWDDKVREIAGGLTIMRSARGVWTDEVGKTYQETMIPVRIMCKPSEMDRIIDMTLEYYDQKAVIAYVVSIEVVLKRRSA